MLHINTIYINGGQPEPVEPPMVALSKRVEGDAWGHNLCTSAMSSLWPTTVKVGGSCGSPTCLGYPSLVYSVKKLTTRIFMS